MRRVIFFGLATIVILLSACNSSQTILPVRVAETRIVSETPPEFPGVGYYYSLPRTAVVVEIEVLKTQNIPGPYARYASRLLGLNDVITRSASNYEIIKVAINSFSEPDPDHLYFISLPGPEATNRFLNFTASGLLLGISTEALSWDTSAKVLDSKDYIRDDADVAFNYFLDINLVERIDTIFEQVREDTITFQRQTLRRSWVEKSSEHRAREVADYILELREKKFDLISGFQEISYSKEALAYMITEMNKLESDYLNLFTGIRTEARYKYRFVHRPAKADSNSNHTLFSFSNIYGVLADDDEDGRPFVLRYKSSQLTDLLHNKGSQASPNHASGTFGIHHRMPEFADISLHLDNELRAEARMLINQFGIVSRLPADDLDIRMHPGTGSIQSIGIPEPNRTR